MSDKSDLSSASAHRLLSEVASSVARLRIWHHRLEYYATHNVAYLPMQHELQEAVEALERTRKLLEETLRGCQ